MRRILSFLVAGLMAGLFAMLAPPSALAGELDELTYFTFSAPVQIPGVALPAGTYMFKLADSGSHDQIVQVFSKDGSTLYATFFAMPDNVVTPTDKPVVTLEETPRGNPEAIKTWFYPGDTIGHEFVYPREQAAKIVAMTRQPVLTMPSVITTQ